MTKSRRILPTRELWTAEQVAVLARLYSDTPTAKIAAQLGTSVSRIYAKADHLGLKKSAAYLASKAACRLRKGDTVGEQHRFKKGCTPWNKGMKGVCFGGEATQFKPGQQPHNELPLGSYRISRDGNLQRKISNDKGSNSKRWRCVHELIWIEVNGAVPAKHIVVFKPGMHSTTLEEITLAKVECISMAENMRRNTCHRYGKDIAQLIQLRGAITRQLNQRESTS